jgi:hypothetical protein
MTADVIQIAKGALPDAFEVVKVVLADGRRTLAVWTGRIWWGREGQVRVVRWESCGRTSR